MFKVGFFLVLIVLIGGCADKKSHSLNNERVLISQQRASLLRPYLPQKFGKVTLESVRVSDSSELVLFFKSNDINMDSAQFLNAYKVAVCHDREATMLLDSGLVYRLTMMTNHSNSELHEEIVNDTHCQKINNNLS
ncbi:GspS/AspS pilotin family protein [Serratia quinivorans]|uniref:GspS/AspS pilotin family protein n=1 Tax=Serratia quinivorans TaxID=137545 RepID=UPI002178E00B|nr:GspS/AspS pilotin family protein [Serratia quinivorans]CAI1114889.1 Uncharacterised protein [Serratia quinivorans]CAI1876377.1 Uncharacterised protein [Serratia quinivorans]